MALLEMNNEYQGLKENKFHNVNSVYIPYEYRNDVVQKLKKYEYSYLKNCLYAIRKIGHIEIVLVEATNPLKAILNVIKWEEI